MESDLNVERTRIALKPSAEQWIHPVLFKVPSSFWMESRLEGGQGTMGPGQVCGGGGELALGLCCGASRLHQPGPWPHLAGDAPVGLCPWTRGGTSRLKMDWSKAKQENKASSPSLNLSFCHSCLFLVKRPLVYEMVVMKIGL